MDPPGNFELVTVHGGVAYVAGHAPIDGSAVLVQGAVGRELTVEEGYRAATADGAFDSRLAQAPHSVISTV